jgi:DNA-binding MarR family transcriptional regulator
MSFTRLPGPIRGVAAVGAPETTQDAADSVVVNGQLARVLDAVRARGLRGALGPEINDEVGLSVSLVSTRLKTLYLRGLIDKVYGENGKPLKRYGPSGRAATVWVALNN